VSYFYLATPYAKYPGGTDEAFKLACREAARLMKSGLKIFSPIAHSHPIALHGGIPLIDGDFWLDQDHPLMDGAKGLIMLMAESWEQSAGMAHELDCFRKAGKPVIYVAPESLLFEQMPVKMENVVC
jgi:Domain of unknown function (DUF1937)